MTMKSEHTNNPKGYSVVFIVDVNDGGSVEMMTDAEYNKLIVEDFAPGLKIEYDSFHSKEIAQQYAALYDQLVKLNSSVVLDFGDGAKLQQQKDSQIAEIRTRMNDLRNKNE